MPHGCNVGGAIKILLVEDEALTAMLLARNLQLSGYSVCGPASTGEAAIEIAKREKPDLVLMDIRLAGPMDGIKAATAIASFSDVPIVFVTGYDDKQLRQRANAVHPAAYLVKPVTPREIEPVIKALFGDSKYLASAPCDR